MFPNKDILHSAAKNKYLESDDNPCWCKYGWFENKMWKSLICRGWAVLIVGLSDWIFNRYVYLSGICQFEFIIIL